MTTETENQQEEARRIWDELDAEDGGAPAPAPEIQDQDQSDETPAQRTDSQARNGSAEYHNADLAAAKPAQVSPDTQALLDRIAGLESSTNQVTSRLRNAEGHIGHLNSQLKESQEAARVLRESGRAAPTAGEIRAAQTSAKGMEKLREEYPQLAEILEPAVDGRIADLERQINEMKNAKPQGNFATKEELEWARVDSYIESRHPGWTDTVAAPEFKGWAERQSIEVRQLAESSDPRAAIRLLDLYQSSRQSAGQKTQRLAAAAALPNGRATSAPAQKSVDDMTKAEYWEYLNKIEKEGT
jgi:hypothetical protein